MAAAPRELSLAPSQIVHPEHLEGRSIWGAPEVQDLMSRLHYGDPTLGWEGDGRLALYRAPGKRWELWRLEADGEYRLVLRSRPGVHLDNRLIMHLVAIDSRRGFDAGAHVTQANEQNIANLEKASSEKIQAARDKLWFGLRKDLGAKFDGTLSAHI